MRGDYEASKLPAGVRVAEIAVDNDLAFVNVNTPHDYARARGRVELNEKSSEDRITE